jgi:hypothetical protein
VTATLGAACSLCAPRMSLRLIDFASWLKLDEARIRIVSSLRSSRPLRQSQLARLTNWRMRRPLPCPPDECLHLCLHLHLPSHAPAGPSPVSRTGPSPVEDSASLVGWSEDLYESFEARGREREREPNRSSEVWSLLLFSLIIM